MNETNDQFNINKTTNNSNNSLTMQVYQFRNYRAQSLGPRIGKTRCFGVAEQVMFKQFETAAKKIREKIQEQIKRDSLATEFANRKNYPIPITRKELDDMYTAYVKYKGVIKRMQRMRQKAGLYLQENETNMFNY